MEQNLIINLSNTLTKTKKHKLTVKNMTVAKYGLIFINIETIFLQKYGYTFVKIQTFSFQNMGTRSLTFKLFSRSLFKPRPYYIGIFSLAPQTPSRYCYTSSMNRNTHAVNLNESLTSNVSESWGILMC